MAFGATGDRERVAFLTTQDLDARERLPTVGWFTSVDGVSPSVCRAGSSPS